MTQRAVTIRSTVCGVTLRAMAFDKKALLAQGFGVSERGAGRLTAVFRQ
jgi:hypothetical protein